MSKQEKIKQLTDLMAGRISRKDLAADRVYIREQIEKGGKIVSDITTFDGKEVKGIIPAGATIWHERRVYGEE